VVIQVTVRVYAELNDFLPPARRQMAVACSLREHNSVKDVIEALGVPHTEVDLLLANGESVGFDYQVQHGDRIAVYPLFRTLDVTPLGRVRPPAPPVTRFVLDTHLGRLAAHLRMLGFDTRYQNDCDDAELARISVEEARILLTRDRGLLKRRAVVHGYHVWETNPERQLVEVARRFRLGAAMAPFTRCMRCNGALARVAKRDVDAQLLPKTRLYYDEFARCTACAQVYWKGSHYERMLRLVASLGDVSPEVLDDAAPISASRAVGRAGPAVSTAERE
jgi:uncharacterized protein with PIN domain